MCLYPGSGKVELSAVKAETGAQGLTERSGETSGGHMLDQLWCL